MDIDAGFPKAMAANPEQASGEVAAASTFVDVPAAEVAVDATEAGLDSAEVARSVGDTKGSVGVAAKCKIEIALLKEAQIETGWKRDDLQD